jgi:hypothetical protein
MFSGALAKRGGRSVFFNLLPPLQSLPPALAKRVGQTTERPSRAVLADYLSTLGLEGEFADFLWSPVSRAHDNELEAPMARYFVIHDTSGPNFGHRSFPDDINASNFVTSELLRSTDLKLNHSDRIFGLAVDLH